MDIEQALAFTDTLVFTKTGMHLSDLQQSMLRESWSLERQSYDRIADTYGYSPTYLKHDVGPKLWKLLSEILGEKVTKTSFRSAIERRFQLEGGTNIQPVVIQKTPSNLPNSPVTTSHQDWGDAIDVDFFYGRQAEIAQLHQWIVVERCRLLSLLGMGGMGKTSLSIKVAQQLQDDFVLVIWRSLRNAPPVQEMLTDLLKFLSNQQEIEFPETVAGKISRLLHYLRSQRCLLIFDNVETILQEGEPTKLSYADGYEAYGEIFRQIGEIRHQSCLLLTSRVQPPEVHLLAGEILPVRALQLEGLNQTDGQELLGLKGTFQGSEDEWRRLIAGYAGNPLALKIISTTIQNLFDGSITDFLNQETFVFGNIRNLIDQQFQGLSESEKTVIYWLAIYRDAATFSELRADIFPPISPQNLIDALELLEQRSLILKTKPTQFSLQPVVMEYITDRLVSQVNQEIQAALEIIPSQKNLLFKTHALLKAQAKDYVRETQIRFILKPILERLLIAFPERNAIEKLLSQCLNNLRGKSSIEIGYAGGNILNLLCQLQPCLTNYNFSDLRIWQAYLQQVNLHDVNFTSADLSQSVFAETFGIVFGGVAFSPDGKLLATGDAEGGLRLWQVATGQLLLNFKGHLGWVWLVTFSGDGQTLASCSSDKTIRLWDVSTGECKKILTGHRSSIWAIAFSADGQTLASGGDEPTVRLWDIHTGECQKILSGHTGRILSVAYSPDGQILASGSDDRTIRLWNHNTECNHIFQGHLERVWSVAFSADGNTLASGSADHTIRLWEVNTGQCLNILPEHSDRVRAIAFSPDAKTLVSASDDQTVRVWEISTGQCLNVLQGHANSVFSVAFNADGRTIASGSIDQTVRLWDVTTGRCFKTFKGYRSSVFSVAFNADGQTIASGSTDQTVRLWDVNTGTCLKTLTGHRGWVTSVAFHPDGKLLASSSVDRTVRIWSTHTGKCLQTLPGHGNWVQSVSFSPDGKVLASGSDDQTIRLWSVNTGECLQILSGHASWIWCVRFSPDGQILASSSEDHTIRLWSVNTGECLQILAGHNSRVQAIAFSPDGQILASASEDETVRLWSMNTGECLNIFAGHSNNVWSVAFSPDGEIIASSSLDQTVRLWHPQTGTCLKILSVLTHSMRSAIAFNPQISPTKNYTIASGSQNGTIQIWDTQTGECLQTLNPDRPYQGTNITGATGITIAQKEALKALGAFEL
ncbi:NB-ARC domain-containing protein [Calothrix sp. PCC 7507]|uniref:WD40 domain-containing protein n=1 Tax=Calothrix sp. PCC 7507 TaxID=99598 RepID=UPI00029F48B3|nr:NB-ARC domain-containing protein [Calothrix sp. PCC 7507]AFY34419.1 WD-40 repeat-containing protein [Calothrix sp. PCC 7507]